MSFHESGTAEKKTYADLRQEYPNFIYHSYNLTVEAGSVKLGWHFEIVGLDHFYPTISLDLSDRQLCNQPDSPLAQRLAFLLGMAELVSYWKITCSPAVEVRAGSLTKLEIEWWKDLYFGGLGEFFFLNEISPDRSDFMSLSALPGVDTEPAGLDPAGTTLAGATSVETEPAKPTPFKSKGLYLIPVGGGKDSVVSLMRLAPHRNRCFTFGINPTPAAVACMEIAGFSAERQVLLKRHLAPEMLALNRRGFLNGHTPFSAIVAFNALFTAYLIGADRIILSNEASADEASVPGTEINHQFSKTTAFEQAFRSYVQDRLGLPIHYFSLLRPFNELCIAREFASYPAFFKAFRSCNVGSKQNVWCGRCAKCLFIAIMLAPFVGLDRLRQILGRDIFADTGLTEILDELTGARAVKAFECVGTVSEVRFALNRLLLQFHPLRQALAGVQFPGAGKGGGEKSASAVRQPALPALLAHYLEQCRAGLFSDLGLDSAGFPFNLPGAPDPLLTFHRNNDVPADLLPLLEGMNRSEISQLLSGQKILVLGFGREGQAALNWLAVHAGELGLTSVGLADLKCPDQGLVDRLRGGLEVTVYSGADYLNALPAYELILKSPGISFKDYTGEPTGNRTYKAFGKAVISGQTDLLLQAGLPQDIVGVTGTKGKSTTTALIADLLQAGGRKAALAGNIGLPVLSAYDGWTADTAVALELSSHQLQFTAASPKVAVITNFYEEHLDHYRSYDEYLDAKLNILRFQAATDTAVLCADSAELLLRALPEVRGRLILVRHGHLTKEELNSGVGDFYEDLASRLPGRLTAAFLTQHLTALYTYAGRSIERIEVAEAGCVLARTPLLNVAADHPALPGSHHLCDVALAAAAVKGLVPDTALAAAVANFSGLPHRSEFVGQFAGIRFYNDSIATIPAATELAMATLPCVRTLIVGGMNRGLHYGDFINHLLDSKLACLIGLPDTGYQICEQVAAALGQREKEGKVEKAESLATAATAGGGHPLLVLKAADMDEAVALAYRHTEAGASCLLSPAASSYNIYKNFEERGNHFKRAVQQLGRGTLAKEGEGGA